MDNMTIKTNNQARELFAYVDLESESERAEFDYFVEGDDYLSPRLFRYKGIVYDLHEFQTTRTLPEFNPLREWDGVQNDSFFSGIVVRLVDDGDSVVVGQFFA